MSRHRFALALILLAAALVFAAPLAKREVFTLRDHLDYFQPLRYFTAEELRAGRLPLWNPYNASGEPWMANPQTGVFYPPAWLFLILPFETAYVAFLLLHVVILGWGAYLFFARTAPRGAALAGAMAVMFSGPVFSLLDVQNNLATFAWVPLALWCAAEGAWRRGAIVLAMAFLGGEPFFAAIGAVLYVVVVFAASPRSKAVAGATALQTAACAFGLAAIQLLPFLDWLRASDRAAGFGAAAILHHSFSLRDWVRVAIPPSGFWKNYILIPYIGISVLLLAVIGLTTIRKHRGLAGWLLLLAATIVLAAGPSLLAQLPLTLFRYPARLLPFASLAIAAMAVRGWERIRPLRRWMDLVVVLVILLDLVPRLHPLLATDAFSRHPIPYAKEIGESEKIARIGQQTFQRREWIAGYLNLYERRFDAFTASPVTSEAYLRAYTRAVTNPSVANLAMFNIGYVLTPRDALPPPFVRVARRGEVRVYRLPTLPMAQLFWREPLRMYPAPWELDTSQARVTIDAPREGILVLRQQAQRGWRVTVDGKPAQSLAVDEVFRAVMLTKGRHEVVWTYHAPLFAIGIVMTIVTLIAMTLSIFVKRSRA